MKKICILIISFLICGKAYADLPVQKVQIYPATQEISFSTVTPAAGWTTAPTVALRGRKAINIFNTSSTELIWLRDVSGTTVTRGTVARRLYPRQDVTFGISDEINIYVSASSAVRVEVTEIR